jgi:hypothetical protein
LIRAAALASLALVIGCSVAPVDLDAAAPRFAPAAAPLTTSLWVEVSDLRLERPAGEVGVARATMWIPRRVSVARDSLSGELRHALLAAFERADRPATGREVPSQPSEGEASERVVHLAVDRLWGEGYFGSMSFDVSLRLHVLDGTGRLLARSEANVGWGVEGSGLDELPYANADDFGRVVVEGLRPVIAALFTPPVLRALGGEGAVDAAHTPGAPATPDAATAPDASHASEVLCRGCREPLQPEWVHCPTCGAKRK